MVRGRRSLGNEGDDLDSIFAQFCDACDHYSSDMAGRLLSDHLGAFVSHDLEATRAAVARLDIRLAMTYPAIAVLHPRQHELARYFPGSFPLSPSGIGTEDRSRFKPVHVMTFVRETGRVRLAGKYADNILEGMAFPSGRVSATPAEAGSEWLTWFQLGRTRLASGELQRAYRDLTAAANCAPGKPPARLTRGYLALVAAVMGDTTLTRHHLDTLHNERVRVGGRLWGLWATARAIMEVEEHTPEADEAVAALARIEDQEPFWPYTLLARTRYAELNGQAGDSLALIESAVRLYSPEVGSFAYDVLTARRIEALIWAGRIAAARSVYEDRAVDAPHCRVASLALLCGEQNYSAIDRQLGDLVGTPNLTSAQRVQAQSFSALGSYLRDGAVPDYDAPGLGRTLSLRANRRVALMFPPLLRDALEPYLSAELVDDWQRHVVRNRLWDREEREAVGSLTQRQVAMLQHLDHGRSYAAIAEAEHVTVNTVKSHLKLLYKKFGVSNSADALAFARRWGLLDSNK